VSSVSGVVRWQTHDLTDLDYTPLPVATRDNREEALQFTQEVRIASAADAPVELSPRARMHWQVGGFLFTQDYDQDAVNSYAPFVLPSISFPIDQHVPLATLDDVGVGLFGQATVRFEDRIDLSFGARIDHERKQATLNTFFSPPLGPPAVVDAERGFSSVSPQVGIAFHPAPEATVYASVSQGFKAGGFNPSSPPGSEIYDEEHAWHAEGGVKSSWAAGRLVANAAVFYVDWRDLQLNLPDPVVLGQFYIANVGAAASRGVEAELVARPHAALSLFGSFGYTRARFKAGTTAGGADAEGNALPNTPDYTAMLGLETTRAIARSSFFGRVESVFYGSFHYDNTNSAGQEAYALTNLRVGLRKDRLILEGWVRNAFDTRYIPVAFAYGPFAPSGFVGEPGRPRTFGATVGVGF